MKQNQAMKCISSTIKCSITEAMRTVSQMGLNEAKKKKDKRELLKTESTDITQWWGPGLELSWALLRYWGQGMGQWGGTEQSMRYSNLLTSTQPASGGYPQNKAEMILHYLPCSAP